jgi:hypothetical protein
MEVNLAGGSKLQKMISSGSSGSFLALFSVRDPLCPFASPTDLVDPPIIWEKKRDIGAAFSPPEPLEEGEANPDLAQLQLFSKDIKLAIQFIAGSAQRRMTKWAQSRVVWHLISLVDTCSAFNLDIFRHHFRYHDFFFFTHPRADLLCILLTFCNSIRWASCCPLFWPETFSRKMISASF